MGDQCGRRDTKIIKVKLLHQKKSLKRKLSLPIRKFYTHLCKYCFLKLLYVLGSLSQIDRPSITF